MMLKAIVLYQPWAQLVAIEAKPLEFRNRDYRRRDGVKVGQRIAVAAAQRPVQAEEVEDLLRRLGDAACTTGLVAAKARPFLERVLAWQRGKDAARRSRKPPPESPPPCPLGVIVCTATIGEPKPSVEAMPSWRPFINDSDRLEHSRWAWPMLEVAPREPIPVRGGRGFFWVSVAGAA